jgi:hypothetical protein
MEASSCPPATRFLSLLCWYARGGQVSVISCSPRTLRVRLGLTNKQTNKQTRACQSIRVGTRRCEACREASQVFTASAKQSKTLLGEARLGMVISLPI